MSADTLFTKENLNDYLKELGKEFRRRGGTKTLDESAYERAYNEILENEKKSRDILLEFDKSNSGALKEDNINAILEQAKRKRNSDCIR